MALIFPNPPAAASFSVGDNPAQALFLYQAGQGGNTNAFGFAGNNGAPFNQNVAGSNAAIPNDATPFNRYGRRLFTSNGPYGLVDTSNKLLFTLPTAARPGGFSMFALFNQVAPNFSRQVIGFFNDSAAFSAGVFTTIGVQGLAVLVDPAQPFLRLQKRVGSVNTFVDTTIATASVTAGIFVAFRCDQTANSSIAVSVDVMGSNGRQSGTPWSAVVQQSEIANGATSYSPRIGGPGTVGATGTNIVYLYGSYVI